MSGVFIAKGMTVSIPPGGLTIQMGPDGRMQANLQVHTRFDVCPTWAALALSHLRDATVGYEQTLAAWKGDDEDRKAAALEREFEASMQAIVAAAISIDAFYAMIQPHVNVAPSTVETWRKGRTARYVQVTEVLRRGFRLKRDTVAALRQNLKEIYRLRDLAVHPSGKTEAPVLRPELGVEVEWKFAWFRAQSAETIVHAATWILWILSNEGVSKEAGIHNYITGLRRKLAALFPDGHPFSATTSQNAGS